MKTWLRTILGATACVLMLTGPALAVGFGGSVEIGGGTGEFEYSDIPNSDFDVDAGYFGMNFVFDTNPGGEGVFAYRLNAGFEALNLEDDYDDTLELGGLVFDNTFAFGFVRTPAVKVWAGPQVRLAFYGGETDKSNIDVNLVAFGIGVAAGANIYPNPQGRFAICPSLGFRRVGYGGTAEQPGGDEDIEGYTNLFYLNVAFLYGR